MKFWMIFMESFKLPNKRALFKLNRVGMDIVVIYLFILLFLVSIPSFIQQITGTSSSGYINDLNLFFQIIYFFIFYYLPINVIVFLLLSLVAYIGLGITKIMKRKLRFAILWKMSAFSITVPFVIYRFIALFIPLNNTFLLIAVLYIFTLLIIMISIYPKRKKQ